VRASKAHWHGFEASVLGICCTLRSATGVHAAHGVSVERHAATMLESTSTTRLIHMYRVCKRPMRQRLIIIVVVLVQKDELVVLVQT